MVSAAHPGSNQPPFVSVPSIEHVPQSPGAMSPALLPKPLDLPSEASKDVLNAPAREAAVSQQPELLQQSDRSNRDRETDSGMAAPAQPFPLPPSRTGGSSCDKHEAPKETLGTATVTFAPSRPVTRNQNAQQVFSASASKAPFSSERPGLIPLRMGLRSGSDAAVNAAKVEASDGHVATEIASPNSGSRAGGQGRGFGRAGRRGRGRSNLHRTTYAQPAGQFSGNALVCLSVTISALRTLCCTSVLSAIDSELPLDATSY